MRALLDCAHLHTGGAIQVGLAILENAARTPSHEWHAVLSGRIAEQAPASLDRSFASVVRLPVRNRSWTKYAQIVRHLPALERAIRPEVVFTVFGPAKWRAQAPHLVGFAIPHLLYPETNVHLWRSGARARLARASLALRLRWVRRTLHNADYLVVETETVRRRIDELHGFPASRIFVVRNSYSPLFVDALTRAGSGRKDRPFTVFVPSAYYLHKNLEIVPRVARELTALTRAPFEFLLTLPSGTPEWQAIEADAVRCGVADRVRTLNAVPHRELAQRYRESDAVFLPTLLECSTAVYPESFAAGVPLATSAIDFAKELCVDAAVYFDPLSPADAARALARLMANPELRTQLMENGRRVLRETYPSPERKWEEQLACLVESARRGKV